MAFVLSAAFFAVIVAVIVWAVRVQVQRGWPEPWAATFGLAVLLMVLVGSLAMVISRWNVVRRATGDDAVDAAFWQNDRWLVLSKYLIRLVLIVLLGSFVFTLVRQSLR